jgi:hypothetical protein
MTAEERLSEAAQILAGALLRLRRRESHKHDIHLEKNTGLHAPRKRSCDHRQRRKVAR